MQNTELFSRLLTEIAKIPVIDTHEHIPPESSLNRNLGLFHYFDHYVSSDLVSAGMPKGDLEKMRDTGNVLSLSERWELMAPYWPFVRTTGYGRGMLEYMADLYDVDDINKDTCTELCRRIKDAHTRGDWYETVLGKANIETALVITWPGMPVTVESPRFRAIPILDHFANVHSREDLEALEAECSRSIHTFDELLSALEERLESFVNEGIAGIKIFQAYRRTLRFDRVDRSDAESCFNRVLKVDDGSLSFAEAKPLEDYVIRYILSLAGERKLPVQIHTGLQEGNGNMLENSRPILLINLFMDFPEVKFDIFHAGYPYVGEVAVMAKNFPNVYADLCWVHAISPHVAGDALAHWLEVIPLNKIFGFGGDSNYIEGAYGYLQIARRVTAEVLAGKVAGGYFSEDEALFAAKRLFRENALDVFSHRILPSGVRGQ